MKKITLLGLICTSLYHYEVQAREPCVQCMDGNQKGVCLTHDSWTPTDAFTPGKRYDCRFFGGDVQCVVRDQDSKAVCSSTKCGFKLDVFTEGTICFIDMHDGFSAHTTIAPSGGNEEHKEVTTPAAHTETWFWPFICMVMVSAISGLGLIILFKTGHIEWKSKKGPLSDKNKKNKSTSQPWRDVQTMISLMQSDHEI